MSYYDSKIMFFWFAVALFIGLIIGGIVAFVFLMNFDLTKDTVTLVCQNKERTIERELYIEDAYLLAQTLTNAGYNCNLDVYGMKYEQQQTK